MKREFLVAVGGAAIVIAGLSGCSSSDKKDSSSDTKATASASATASVEAGDAKATTGSGTARVSIDGKDHKVEGTVVCATVAGNVTLTVGQGVSGVSATLGEGDQPSVTAVALGNIDGVSLTYAPGMPGGSAEATKDGNKYTVKGDATGMDGMNPVTKPFELEVSCP
ncbi:lipoprotein LpqH [Mycobacterium sp. DL440]|uniref:lipoprotein LpqH n=1 Tax=Mycobacterium sp. DL440 TaxID=2675523 RepID=UPI00141DE1EA|nr:lipoprotein LpqH [Mycobacterium sp. DL440]